ncbi:hypothetical protein V8C40DRAFT_283124 [Trichoderma camerunense]
MSSTYSTTPAPPPPSYLPPRPHPPPPPPHIPPQENATAGASRPSRGAKRSTMKTIRLLFGRQVRNGQPNPVLVSVATRGYNIQSRVLHIPDSIGIFTRGSPRRSAWEGFVFVYASLNLLLLAGMFACWIMILEDYGDHSAWIPISIVVLYIAVVMLIWVVVIYNPRRRPGYNWRDNPQVQVV